MPTIHRTRTLDQAYSERRKTLGFFPRFLSLLLASLQVAIPVAQAKEKPDSTAKESPEKKKPVLGETLAAIKKRKLRDYMDSGKKTVDTARLEADLAVFHEAAFAKGVYVDRKKYEAWWKDYRKLCMDPQYVRGIADHAIGDYSSSLYLLYVGEEAKRLDAADPETQKKKSLGLPTAGETYLARTQERMEKEPIWQRALGISWQGGMVVLVFLGGALASALMFGPVTNIVNTVLQPVMRPFLEKIDSKTWRYIAPRLVWWQRLLSGKGVDESISRVPGVSNDTNAEIQFQLRNAGFNAQNIQASVIPQVRAARGTYMDLIHNGQLNLGDRMQRAKTYQMSTEIYFETVLRRKLDNKISDSDLAKFKELIDRQQEIYTFMGDVPEVYERDGEIRDLIQRWKRWGVSDSLVNELYYHQIDRYVGENAPAMALVSFLNAELYWPDTNILLAENKETRSVLEKQEVGRQIQGVYSDMLRYKDKIEAIFRKFDINYDVQERLNQGQVYTGRIGRSARSISDCARMLERGPLPFEPPLM
jgi:hypothetical protein